MFGIEVCRIAGKLKGIIDEKSWSKNLNTEQETRFQF